MSRFFDLRVALLIASFVFAGTWLQAGCDSGTIDGGKNDGAQTQKDGGSADTSVPPPPCQGGVDKDGDNYGLGCPAGSDCNDSDPTSHPGAKEVCDGADNNCDGNADEGVKNKCGTCSLGCKQLGSGPFPVDSKTDPSVKQVDGVGLDKNGDLILDSTKTDFNFMWIANTDDFKRGTISKIDTVKMKEVGRYQTITCRSKPGTTGCVGINGVALSASVDQKPSRTAVDLNFDVWVANRAFGQQASATKIANSPSDCIDRNKNSKIETSTDHNGDGKITADCNGDGQLDNGSTVCTGAFAGKPPEYLGDDDECILFSVAYGGLDDVGRSICLDGGIDTGVSNAWVGTNKRSTNRYYRIDGKTGAIKGPYDLGAGHKAYGCAVDGHRVLWSAATGGTVAYLNTINPTQVGQVKVPPWAPVNHYGIAVDANSHVWLGGWDSGKVYRYKPRRTSFSTLGSGVWTGLTTPKLFDYTRGIAADNRGKVWVASTNGYIWRVEQSIADGLHDLTADKNYWKTSGTGVIGVGVDFKGNIWGVSHNGDQACRLDVDAAGNVIQPQTCPSKTVPVGKHPYTYSDFTGFGLKNFTLPRGLYVIQLEPCGAQQARWEQVAWQSSTPANTAISVRVRSGDNPLTLGNWFGPYQKSPANLGKSAATPLMPNPARILEIEFELTTKDKALTPILKAIDVSYSCHSTPG